jgi:hypothetical protein
VQKQSSGQRGVLTWKKRYAVLERVHASTLVTYYERQGGTQKGVQVVTAWSETTGAPVDSDKPHQLVLACTGRPAGLTFAFDTAVVRAQWMAALAHLPRDNGRATNMDAGKTGMTQNPTAVSNPARAGITNPNVSNANPFSSRQEGEHSAAMPEHARAVLSAQAGNPLRLRNSTVAMLGGGAGAVSIAKPRSIEDVGGALEEASNDELRARIPSVHLTSLPQDVREELTKFDVDGTGTVNAVELIEQVRAHRTSMVAQGMLTAKVERKRAREKILRWTICGLVFFTAVLLFAGAALTKVVVDMSKETQVSTATGAMTVKGTEDLIRVASGLIVR